MKLKYKCQYCGNEFVPERTKQKFCSKKCAAGNRRSLHKKKCVVCGNDFNHPRNITCSEKCHRILLGRNYSKNHPGSYGTCPNCGKVFKKPHKDTVFCSIECFSEYSRKNNTAVCQHCGKTFWKKNVCNANKYCSKECASKAQELKVEHICPKCKKPFMDTPTGNRLCQDCIGKYTGTSGFEEEFYEWISSILGEGIRHDRKVLGGREIDILYPELHVGFECQGKHWHASPLLYKPKDIINGRTAREIWDYDELKEIDAREAGIDLIPVWENAWYDGRDILCNEIMKRIKKA